MRNYLFLLLGVIGADASQTTIAAPLTFKFEGEVYSSDWPDGDPLGRGNVVSGDFTIERGFSGWLQDVLASHFVAGSLPLEAAPEGFNAILLRNDTQSPGGVFDELVVCVGGAGPSKVVNVPYETYDVESPAYLPDTRFIDDYAEPGYGAVLHLTGPATWFGNSSSLTPVTALLSSYQSATGWIEYTSITAVRTYADFNLTSLVAVPEPNAGWLALTLIVCVIGHQTSKK